MTPRDRDPRNDPKEDAAPGSPPLAERPRNPSATHFRCRLAESCGTIAQNTLASGLQAPAASCLFPFERAPCNKPRRWASKRYRAPKECRRGRAPTEHLAQVGTDPEKQKEKRRRKNRKMSNVKSVASRRPALEPQLLSLAPAHPSRPRFCAPRLGTLLFAAALAFSATRSPAAAATYKVDPDHTTVSFSVRHLFTRVTGRFDRFEGTIVFDPAKPEATEIRGSIEAASVNTNVAERDKDLRSKNFFFVEKHPKILFESTSISDIDQTARTAKVHGKLTIRGVTRDVVIDGAYLGAAKDPWGNQRAGFSASLTINRKDYGLTWNEILETGGVLVGDEVEIRLDVEAIMQE